MTPEDKKTIEDAHKATTSLLDKMKEQGWLDRSIRNGEEILDFTEDGRIAMTMLRALLHPGGGDLPKLEAKAFFSIVKSSVYLPT